MYSGRGSTFDGCITEFPGVGADRFNCNASVFFLSHHHADHTVGLRNVSFNFPVYCSEGTKTLLESNVDYNHVQHLIKPLQYNQKHKISVARRNSTSTIAVTLIPSYHCPGSCMFLFEQEGKTALYTGDIRAEDWWVSSLAHNPFLYPFTTVKQLDTIYVDTSFAYKGEPFTKHPANREALQIVTQILDLYPKDDPEIQYYFSNSISGMEECWIKLAFAFNLDIHADEKNFGLLETIKRIHTLHPHGHDLARVHKSSETNTKSNLHACGRYWKCNKDIPKFPVTIDQYSDFNVVDFLAASMPVNLELIHTSEKAELREVDITEKGTRIFSFKNRNWILSKDGSELLPDNLKLLFCRHSSYEQTLDLIKLFKPREVFPCCESRQTWLNGFTMKRIFGDVCTSTSQRYDEMMNRKHGKPLERVSTRKVEQINRWSVADCEKERKFIEGFFSKLDRYPTSKIQAQEIALEHAKSYEDSPGNPFLMDVEKYKKHDMNVQNMVADRKGQSYADFINRCQNKFFEVHQNGTGIWDARDTQSSSYSTLSSSEDKDFFNIEDSNTVSKRRAPCLVRKQKRDRNTNGLPVVLSSFDSFEKSFTEHSSTLDNTILFRSSKKMEPSKIAKITTNLVHDPQSWRSLLST